LSISAKNSSIEQQGSRMVGQFSIVVVSLTAQTK